MEQVQSEELNRIGYLISRRPDESWRDVVIRYASLRGKQAQCVTFFDKLLADNMLEPWAALRALDEFCCADVIMNTQTTPLDMRSLN